MNPVKTTDADMITQHAPAVKRGPLVSKVKYAMRSSHVPRWILTLFVTLAFFCGRESNAQIVVSGSPPPRVSATQKWCDSYLPDAFRLPNRPLPVRLVSPRQMRALVEDDDGSRSTDDSRVDGLFQTEPPRISLRVENDDDPDFFTLAHEYGHFVWSDVFSKDDRRRYETLYKRQRDAHSLVTRYAASDPEEGFAEAFSFYVNDPIILQSRDPRSAQFLRDWADAHAPKK